MIKPVSIVILSWLLMPMVLLAGQSFPDPSNGETAFYTPYLIAPLTEFMIYFWFMGVVHVVVIIAGLVIATPTLFFNVRRYLVFSRGYIVFNVVLLLVCALLNMLWSYTIWEVAYFSMDYVTDFSPFWPVTQHMIDAEFGGKTGRMLAAIG